MGGMTTLEWPLCTLLGYIQDIVPITTCAYHGAWGISWGETQRQSIFSDSVFSDGLYDPIPSGQSRKGLGTARMIGMLTYRSYGSFESRVSRRPTTIMNGTPLRKPASLPTPPLSQRGSLHSETNAINIRTSELKYAAQNYLEYQATKFLKRFDANCYIHLTKKMDSHDITRGRSALSADNRAAIPPTDDDLTSVLSHVPPKALGISVASDVLFQPEQQVQLARCLPEAKYVALDSPGHYGFLLEFEDLNKIITAHLSERCPWAYESEVEAIRESMETAEMVSSVFGEAEALAF